MNENICIHGHFYQPPRENPWLGSIVLQDSAYPYHDWNERITAECYAPNTGARILNKAGKVERIINNYSRISFNFGPTLLAWLEKHAPEVYKSILEADRESRRRFSGHGSAMAQPYNHLIMPLANQRDRHTQVLWGIKDFRRRFGRRPEGMWLPEAAVDRATLGILAEQGILFTVLAPHQAARVRPIGVRKWEDVNDANVDITMPYRVTLPSRRRITVFFYDGPTSRAVAFERLLDNGEAFAKRLASGFSKANRPQLVHIATDGETYGHHHAFGEMALAYALRYIESQHLARITNYGEYLEKHPPTHEAQVAEETSWSCCHGVERWRSDCGCNTGAHPAWNQAWRGPLREAMDWLRDELAASYESAASSLLNDPWAARDDYIEVIHDRSPASLKRFFATHGSGRLSEADRTAALKLLELQRHSMLMFTSDGWFFDDISGIEPVQILQYAARAMELAKGLFGDSLEERFLELLEPARSNLPEMGDGRAIYERFVRPATVDPPRVAAHFAMSSLLSTEPVNVPGYRIEVENRQDLADRDTKLFLGQAKVTSEVTLESADLAFAALSEGGRLVRAGVANLDGDGDPHKVFQEMAQKLASSNLAGVSKRISEGFSHRYDLSALFHDERRRLMERLLEGSMAGIEAIYGQLYRDAYQPDENASATTIPSFHRAISLMIELDLRRGLSSDRPNPQKIADTVALARSWKVELDQALLAHIARQCLERAAARFAASPTDPSLVSGLSRLVRATKELPFAFDLWPAQTRYYRVSHSLYPDLARKARSGDSEAARWVEQFRALGEQLSVGIS